MSTPNPRAHRGPRPHYTEQFKADAVAMVTELGKSRAQVAEDLQLNPSTLGRWVAAATGTTGRGRGSHNKPADPTSTDPDQLARRVAELEAENAFLKKAAAFFARDTR